MSETVEQLQAVLKASGPTNLDPGTGPTLGVVDLTDFWQGEEKVAAEKDADGAGDEALDL